MNSMRVETNSLLSVRDLRVWFDTQQGPRSVVEGVSFDIKRGETFALLGESGCGKSVTALSIMQLLPPQAARNIAGEVSLDGVDLLTLSDVEMRQVRGGRIAMIFQEPMTSLNAVMTIGGQIEESLRIHQRLRRRAARRQAIELLSAVGIPDPARRVDEYPHQLSGGMKQRVMIAIALAGKPDLLIADEPTTALDVTIQAQVLDLLADLQRQTGMAMLLITHDLGVVYRMAQRVAVMYAGRIVELARCEAFFKQPRHPYSQRLFAALPSVEKRGQPLRAIPGTVPAAHERIEGCQFAPRCDRVTAACHAAEPELRETVPDHRVRCILPLASESTLVKMTVDGVEESSTRAPELELLHVRDLKVHFPIRKGLLKRTVGYVHAVDGVSFSIARSKTLALVGESGCGKTTTGKALLQLLRPTAGLVTFEGIELTQLRGEALRRRRREFQIIFQDPYASMNPRMMVGDIIVEGLVAQGIGKPAERQARVAALLEQVGLWPEAQYRYPHEFSGGQRQRICIARALALQPKLIVCDEPTSALDVSVQAQILNLLRQLQQELGLSYLFITHNLAVVSYLADEVAVMYMGRIVESGTVAEVLGNPQHPYTQALLEAVPLIDEATRRGKVRLPGDPPSPVNPPPGCHFHPRCPYARPECRLAYPEAKKTSESHIVRCILVQAV